jgi:hypothetical protein
VSHTPDWTASVVPSTVAGQHRGPVVRPGHWCMGHWVGLCWVGLCWVGLVAGWGWETPQGSGRTGNGGRAPPSPIRMS